MAFVCGEKTANIDQYANCCTIVPKVCNFTNHEKSKKISAPEQCNAKQDLILISKNFFDMLLIICFL